MASRERKRSVVHFLGQRGANRNNAHVQTLSVSKKRMQLTKVKR